MMDQVSMKKEKENRVKGAVDPDTLRGKIPDSKRVGPYDPESHPSSKYALEPDTRPENYDPGSETSFDMARRKLHTLLLGIVLGAVIIVIGLVLGLLLGRDKHSPSTDAVPTGLKSNNTVYS